MNWPYTVLALVPNVTRKPEATRKHECALMPALSAYHRIGPRFY